MFHNRKVFPTKLHHEREEFEGAYVDSWANGLHENVVVFDVKSLYPSIIVSANLSPESIAPDDAKGKNIIALGDVRVDLSIKGFLPEVINSLFVERTKFKSLMKKEKLDSDMYKFYDMRQKSVKRLLNALYGQTAFPNSRIFNSKVAEAITWTGREIIKWSKNFLEDIGYKVIYVDTDSTHVLFDDISISNITMILGMLNDSNKEFVSNLKLPSNIFEMDFEKIYRKAFYGHETKKRYAGYIVYKDGKEADKLDIWGFEAKRSDSSQFSRNLQRKVFDMILKENKSKDEVMHFVGDEIARIRSGNFKFTEIGVPKGMSKDPEDYGKDVVDINGVVEKDAQGRRVKKGVPANIRGAKYTQDNLGFELSSKPKMIYIAKMPDRYPKTDVLCFDEDVQVPPGVVLDVETTLKKSVNDKLDSIFDSLGWEMRELNIFWKGKPKNKMGDQQVMEL
jgi:DNA polymerase I